MREIDLFENRLQLKTLQEGLKHKVASVDITPNLVHGVFLPERRRTASERRWQAFAEQHQSDGRQRLLKSMCVNDADSVKGGVDDYTAKFADVASEEMLNSLPSQPSDAHSQLSGSSDFLFSAH